MNELFIISAASFCRTQNPYFSNSHKLEWNICGEFCLVACLFMLTEVSLPFIALITSDLSVSFVALFLQFLLEVDACSVACSSDLFHLLECENL